MPYCVSIERNQSLSAWRSNLAKLPVRHVTEFGGETIFNSTGAELFFNRANGLQVIWA